MRRLFADAQLPLLLVAAMLPLAGCRQYEPPANRLVNDDMPLEVDGREAAIGYVAVRLYRIENGEVAAEPASDDMVEADGTFRIFGREGKGVPPGTYRVEVLQYDPYPNDALGGRFSREQSPIEVEVNEANDGLQIDLSDYQ